MKKGVFWIIDDELHSYPFDDTQTDGIAKSGDTYNHKKLWKFVKPKGCNKPYNYYPRGRVEITNKGNPVIYMNPNIDSVYIKSIKNNFEIFTDVCVRYDYSKHYRCYLDR
ncbi:MAG: hypothetical protein NC247_09795 [Ruminococcus flavefaciens]|nr:hypothetical protein [Ruminococcus flavefaciens]MCM1362248.1 hypothetical protein [Clostridiales bacterium]